MNEIMNKCFLAGNRFMQEMHLKQPGFTYSACGPFTKKKKELKHFCRQEIQISSSFLIKSLVEGVLSMNQIISWQMSFINELLKNLRKKKFIHRLETIFGALI